MEEELCLQVVPWAAGSTLQCPRPGGARPRMDSNTENAEVKFRGKGKKSEFDVGCGQWKN